MTGRLRAFQPSLTDLLGSFLAAMVVLVGAQRLFGDSDPAMHVATGRWVIAMQAVPRVDPFSATHAGGEWFAHEWMADVLWALIHRAAGWPGLVAWSAILIASAHVLLYRLLLRRGDHALAAFVAVVGAAIAAASHWLARPHLLTILPLVATVGILEDFVEDRVSARRLAFLPLIVITWVNLHGGFLIVFPVLGCYLIAAAVSSRRHVLPLLLATAGSAVASLMNPYGIRLPFHLLEYFASHRAGLVRNAEFAPATLSDRAGVAILFFLVLALFAFTAERVLQRGKLTGASLAFVVTSALTMLSIRHAEVAAIFAALLVSSGGSVLLSALSGPETRADLEALRAREQRCGGACFLVFLAGIAVLAAKGYPRNAGYDATRFPVAMVAQLRSEHAAPAGPLFSRDLWGGYLTLEWPEAHVFVDGRSDMYGDAFMERYGEIYDARPGWQESLDEQRVAWALLPLDAPLAAAMGADRGWERLRQDAVAVCFHRVGALR